MPTDTFDPVAWDQDHPLASISELGKSAARGAAARIAWYKAKSRSYSSIARAVRVFLILLIGLGGLAQLLGGTKLLEKVLTFDFTAWSYLSFALAGGLFGFDKFFGFSSGWIRFITTELALERVVVEFDYDFALLRANAQEGALAAPQITAMLQRIKDFALQIEALVKQETDSWAADFQNSMAEIEKLTKTEAAKNQQGSVRVVVTDSSKYKTVDVFVNDVKNLTLAGNTEAAITNLFPGTYTISASATAANGALLKASKVVEVQSAALAVAELQLGGP